MTSELSIRMRSGQTWLRLALMIIYFFIAYTVVRLLVGISMLFQFVHQLVKGSRAERLDDFTAEFMTILTRHLDKRDGSPHSRKVA